jgi:hypothetical protein
MEIRINGIHEYKLGQMNKEFKKEYLNECLQLIVDGEFELNAVDIANRCVHMDDTLHSIDEVLNELSNEVDENDGIDIEDLQEFKNEGYDYIDGNLQPWEFENDKEIILYALENLYQ